MKSAVLNLGKTTSGFSGKSERCRRNLSPIACAVRRTAISGRVFFPRTFDMSLERFEGIKRSIAYSAAIFAGEAMPKARAIAFITAVATGGETLFPIILKLCQTVGWKR